MLPADVNLVRGFPDGFTPLAVMPHLNEEVVSDVPMEEIEEDTINEEEDIEKGDDLEVEIVKENHGTRMIQRRKRTRASQKDQTILSPVAKKAKAKTPVSSSPKSQEFLQSSHLYQRGRDEDEGVCGKGNHG